MSFLTLLLASSATPLAAPAISEAIIVTGAREPVARDEAPLSATLFDEATIDALGFPLAIDALRLAPGVAVAISGPRGSQTQLRIRGAEANHSLLFVDGIRFNDPAAGNEARFELLPADPLSRLELVRGPQSALWGSEALGGVVAAETPDPFAATGLSALAEYGSLDSSRIAAEAAGRMGALGLSATAGWARSDGIDAFGQDGERDGFDNRNASLKAIFAPDDSGGQLGLVFHHVEGRSEYDGFDPLTFLRADTLDSTENRLSAIGGWGRVEAAGWSLRLSGSLLDSRNRNLLADTELNTSFGRRFALGAQASRDLALAGTRHRLTLAAEHETEQFRATDTQYGGATDQVRSRGLDALVGQWRADWSPALATDVALRHDRFSAFDDATTLRAAILVRPATAVIAHVAYGEGIAQPTFYDLFGFFPGSFVGNPDLTPERSRGIEAGLRFDDGRIRLGGTLFTTRLTDEIVDIFDPVTFLSSTENADGRSRRRGAELDAGYRHSAALNLSLNYTYLDAREQQVAGSALVREVRRPRHSANAIIDGASGPLRWTASLAYVGPRADVDFDQFPAAQVTLDDYVLGGLRLGWQVTPALEAYGRVENLFAADYQDVVGYFTPGRTVYAGLRLRFGG